MANANIFVYQAKGLTYQSKWLCKHVGPACTLRLGRFKLRVRRKRPVKRAGQKQEGQPRWTVKTTADGAPSLHLSYHGQEHYNSVRLVDDYGRGPPQPIRLGEGGATAADHARVGALPLVLSGLRERCTVRPPG